MKVLYFATYYIDHYVRQDVIIDALEKIKGIELIKCVVNKKSPLRYFQAIGKFIFTSKKDVDVIFVGFRGHEVLPLLRLLTRKPIIFDAFLSLYDTLCFERKKFSPNSLAGKFLFWFDRHNLKIADHVILDTKAHANYFRDVFRVPEKKLTFLYVGSDQNIFYPREKKEISNKFVVFYYSTFRPLHGVECVVKAAKLLSNDKDIIFRIIGRGPEKNKIIKMSVKLELNNINFVDWLELSKLSEEMANADICLGGHFSVLAKAKRVIPGKVFQFLAMKKAVIVGNGEANKEIFKNRDNCLMVNGSDSEDLKRAILELKNDKILRDKISEKGHQTFLSVQNGIKESLEKKINETIT
ncbi:MAG: glycosyltransferase [Patescibacteria group bacterium]